jgi:outer membrane lipoprotein SlyB
VTPVLAVAVLVMALGAVGVARVGLAAADRARARTAADAAALAGAAGGEDEARELARRNGARMIGYREEGSDVVVVVQFDEAQATARARLETTGDPRKSRG